MKIFAPEIKFMRTFLLAVISFASASLNAQMLNPVSWTFTAKKTADKTFEVHLTANIQSGWHIYSQTQPGDAIAIPTSVTINNNPLIKLDGKIKEVGKLEKHTDETVKATN